MNQFKKTITLAVGKTSLKLKKYAPEILIVAGIGSMVGATVLACRATLKAEEVIKKYNEDMEKVEYANEIAGGTEDYPIEQYQKEKRIVTIQTAVGFVKLYGPAITLGVVGVGCILTGHNIMKKRNLAIIAAYKLLEQSFTDYRGRVTSELGAEKDYHFMHGTEYVETTETQVDENGKKKKVSTTEQVLNGVKCSGYARLFGDPETLETEHKTTQWCPKDNTTGDINMMFVVQKMNWLNEKLNAYGHVFLNEVYEELGFEPTQAGQLVGWVKGANGGDGYISFGEMVERLSDEDGRVFTHDDIRYRKGDPILLDFNVDGVIWDLMEK